MRSLPAPRSWISDDEYLHLESVPRARGNGHIYIKLAFQGGLPPRQDKFLDLGHSSQLKNCLRCVDIEVKPSLGLGAPWACSDGRNLQDVR